MSIIRIVLIFALAGVAAACATVPAEQVAAVEPAVVDEATATSKETVVAENDAEVDDDRIICKRTTVTGSRFSKKVCRTWGEWKTMQQASRGSLSETQRLGTYGNIQPESGSRLTR